jgi:hypothetical protein
LERLIKISQLHHAYDQQATRLQAQLYWLIDLQRILDTQLKSSQDIETHTSLYLLALSQRQDLDEIDQAMAQHIISTFCHRCWGLFVCYDTPGLPATNNDLESFFGRLKSNQRRITGHTSVNRFILRYGAYVAFVDPAETKTDLLHRLRYVDRAAYQRERQQLHHILAERRDYYRFCHKLDAVVKELEDEWLLAVSKAAQISHFN